MSYPKPYKGLIGEMVINVNVEFTITREAALKAIKYDCYRVSLILNEITINNIASTYTKTDVIKSIKHAAFTLGTSYLYGEEYPEIQSFELPNKFYKLVDSLFEV